VATTLVGIADIQRYLSNFESQDVELLEQIEADAVSDIARRSGRTLALDGSAVARIRDGGGSDRLLLPTPVTSGSVTLVRTRETQSSDWITIDSAAYSTRTIDDLQTDELLRLDDEIWPAGRATVEVTYVSGYTFTTLPGWLRDTVLRWIGSTYAARVQEATAFEEDATGVGTEQIPPDVGLMFEAHLAAMQQQGPPMRLWRG